MNVSVVPVVLVLLALSVMVVLPDTVVSTVVNTVEVDELVPVVLVLVTEIT